MSEKRFTLTWFNKEKKIWRITDKKGISIITLGGVEDRLNELNDENEQLRKELDNFKPVMFQDMRKGTVILYSKGDIV